MATDKENAMAVEKEKKCFVIGPIGEERSPERADADWLLQGIVKPALENDPFNYRVQRADEIAEPGSITDQIIGAVIEADIVVADLTGANANAFYELAIRHMEQRAVIHIAKKNQALPFDIRDYRAVFYSRDLPRDIEEAKAALSEQVKAVEDPAYEPSNPITKARGVLELARTGDPKDKILADLVEGQRRLEARLKVLEPLTVVPDWFLSKHGTAHGNTLLTKRNLRTAVVPADFQSEGRTGLLSSYLTAGEPRSPNEEDDES